MLTVHYLYSERKEFSVCYVEIHTYRGREKGEKEKKYFAGFYVGRYGGREMNKSNGNGIRARYRINIEEANGYLFPMQLIFRMLC